MPANYSVPEGENEVLTLVTDKRFEISFTVDVSLVDVTAIGKCVVHIFLLVPWIYKYVVHCM